MYKDIGEKELARLCGLKDVLAEAELYRRYAAGILTLCRRYLGGKDEAMDIMHDTFIRAFANIETFKYTTEGSLYLWISRISINLALNHIKRHQWRMMTLDIWHQDIQDDKPIVIDVSQEKLLEWIETLPELQRTIFNLYCLDGFSHKEIAQMLNISEKGSAGLLSKAKKKLRVIVNKYLMEEQQ